MVNPMEKCQVWQSVLCSLKSAELPPLCLDGKQLLAPRAHLHLRIWNDLTFYKPFTSHWKRIIPDVGVSLELHLRHRVALWMVCIIRSRYVVGNNPRGALQQKKTYHLCSVHFLNLSCRTKLSSKVVPRPRVYQAPSFLGRL